MFQIRHVKPCDYPAITEIYNHYVTETDISFEVSPLTVEQMARRIEEIASTYPYFICEIDGKVTGYCYAHPWKTRAAYAATLESTIYLHPAYLRQGLGRMLMQVLICHCREEGYDNLIACITYGNEASCALHEALGFKKASHFRHVGRKLGRMLDVVDYQMELQPDVSCYDL